MSVDGGEETPALVDEFGGGSGLRGVIGSRLARNGN